MRVTHILLSLKGGGIQNFLMSLIPEQVRMGHDVSVIVTDEDNLEYSNNNKKRLEEIGVQVYNLNRKVSDKVSFFKTWFACRRLIKILKPDIVNSHGLYCHDVASFSTRRTKSQHCCTIHNAPEPWDRLTKLMNRNVPLIFCSDAAYKLRGQNSKTMVAINNGIEISNVRVDQKVNLHKELGIPENDKIVALVGSPRPQKNYSFLIEVVKELNDEHIHFCICGGQYKVDRKGNNNSFYIDLDQFSQYPNIHLLGLRNDISAVLNGADLYLSCSVREGLPISALEAFFSGIPCVLSPIIQHKMIAGDIDSCFIPKEFEAKYFVEAIKQALKCNNSHDAIYMRRMSNLKKFLIGRCAKEYIDFYKTILK